MRQNLFGLLDCILNLVHKYKILDNIFYSTSTAGKTGIVLTYISKLHYFCELRIILENVPELNKSDLKITINDDYTRKVDFLKISYLKISDSAAAELIIKKFIKRVKNLEVEVNKNKKG